MSRNDFGRVLVKRVTLSLGLNTKEMSLLDGLQGEAYDLFLANHHAVKNKYKDISEYNVDQCIHFFVFLQGMLHEKGLGFLAEKVYYFTRVNFCIDIYPSRRLPKQFLLVHPLGSILGDASYEDWLVIYQNVTVGGNPKLEYPSIREACILYAGSKVLGRSVVGRNSIIGAGVIVNNEEVPENTILYLDSEQKRKSRSNNKDNRKRYFE